MSLALTLFSLIAAWMAVALAMLWGVLRIARRHQVQPQYQPAPGRRAFERPRANYAGTFGRMPQGVRMQAVQH